MSPELSRREQAILSLLSDQDATFVRRVLERLDNPQEIARLLAHVQEPALRKLLATLHERCVRHERLTPCRERYRTLQTLAELEEFCWDMAAWHHPELHVRDARPFLDFWGQTVRERLGHHSATAQQAEILCSVLAREEGFRGFAGNRPSMDHGLLDRVIATRQGLPIILCAIYMFVGNRAGIPVEGIALPGHYVVRIHQQFLDPFAGGQILSSADVAEQLGQAGLDVANMWPTPDSPKHMAQRILITQRSGAGIRHELEWSEAYLEILRCGEDVPAP